MDSNVQQDILSFVEERIDQLSALLEIYQESGDDSLDDYISGAIDAYDIIRMKLTDD